MSELQFAKQFLTSLDAKAVKFQPDHAFDPKTFATRIPYTLPKLSHPPHPEPPKSGATLDPAPGSEPAPSSAPPITLTLKSNRNPNMSLTLTSLPISTPVASVKERIQSHLGGPPAVSLEKIKIILNKKPIPSSKKTLADAFADTDVADTTDVALSVMVMGGAVDPAVTTHTEAWAEDVDQTVGPESEKAAAEALAADAGGMEGVMPTTTSSTADDELAKPEFWSDLEAFLGQRLKDESRAKQLRGTFESAWSSSRAAP
ncbi:uncharacterized protein HMPREF1541_10289 [Cyphellophora europaea CBS 101466]|uniref:Ubiquitin-like domain-containing protein n=1 Tax=Cyphellophora europaea (strain CBS 101466) TaxID=1220924 RepID=W2S9M0_CYPE1|nr:uncharacterized protein HMPREF1541_10289 [Cyphellophora europaea CBS 101466]ETN44619.1 hypothetical protein HMPREF1541_10289 [Cyphellophora europaea CBS 101466]